MRLPSLLERREDRAIRPPLTVLPSQASCHAASESLIDAAVTILRSSGFVEDIES